MRAIFSHRLDVRFRDCDPMGHVNNAVYLTYLEQARLALWRSLWGFGSPRSGDSPASASLADQPPPRLRRSAEAFAKTEARADGTRAKAGERDASDVPGVILARAEVDFRLPARYGDVLDVRIGLAAIGRTSFTYEYEIVDAEKRLVATARSVQVMYDYQAGRPVPIPDAIRRLLEGVDRAV